MGLVLYVSPKARQLADALEQRFDLERNKHYPEEFRVDCPVPGCVGLGYLEFDTVMCFVCEHRWLPRCHVLIEKDGGCDHMTCQCGYDFWWSTLEVWTPQQSELAKPGTSAWACIPDIHGISVPAFDGGGVARYGVANSHEQAARWVATRVGGLCTKPCLVPVAGSVSTELERGT